MAQSSIDKYFIARKRGLEDDATLNKKKVICLERAHSSSESQNSLTDSEELGAKVVFPKLFDYTSCNDGEPKKVVRKPTVRQGITPQRTTRSKKVQMQNVDGHETPKVVNFWKCGNLSPQKKSKGFVEEVPKVQEQNIKDVQELPGMSTPTKPRLGSVEKTPLLSTNGMSVDDVKKKLKGSSRLTELKTALNKLNGGLDKLDQMERTRLNNPPMKRAEPAEAPKTLKHFQSIQLEILR